VRCVTGSFGLTDDWKHAERAAAELGFPFERVELDRPRRRRGGDPDDDDDDGPETGSSASTSTP